MFVVYYRPARYEELSAVTIPDELIPTIDDLKHKGGSTYVVKDVTSPSGFGVVSFDSGTSYYHLPHGAHPFHLRFGWGHGR